MPLPIELKDADIIFTRDWTPISWLIRLAEGDCDYSHVCIYYQGKIYTTGGKAWLWFGPVDPEEYLKDKTFAVGRYRGLKAGQAAIVGLWCETQEKNLYPIWKVVGLIVQSWAANVVYKAGLNPGMVKKDTFCAESVEDAYELAGIELNPKSGKKANTYTPETIWNGELVDIVWNPRGLNK